MKTTLEKAGFRDGTVTQIEQIYELDELIGMVTGMLKGNVRARASPEAEAGRKAI